MIYRDFREKRKVDDVDVSIYTIDCTSSIRIRRIREKKTHDFFDFLILKIKIRLCRLVNDRLSSFVLFVVLTCYVFYIFYNSKNYTKYFVICIHINSGVSMIFLFLDRSFFTVCQCLVIDEQ